MTPAGAGCGTGCAGMGGEPDLQGLGLDPDFDLDFLDHWG